MVHFVFDGHDADVIGSFGSGSVINNMPTPMVLNGTDAYAQGASTMPTVTGTTGTVSMWVYYDPVSGSTGDQRAQGEKMMFSDSDAAEARKIILQTRNYGSHGASLRFGWIASDGQGKQAKDTGGVSGVLVSGTWQHMAVTAGGGVTTTNNTCDPVDESTTVGVDAGHSIPVGSKVFGTSIDSETTVISTGTTDFVISKAATGTATDETLTFTTFDVASCFVDGKFLSDGTFSYGNSYAQDPPTVGRMAHDASRYFPGIIRDVQVYNVSSTTADMELIMKGEFPHGTPIHHWTLDNGDGEDYGSGADSDMTLTNTTHPLDHYNLNQMGSGSLSGSMHISGGTWNMKDSSYLDFDGTDDKVENTGLDDMPGTQGTISVWFNPDDLSPQFTLVDMFDSADSSNKRTLLYHVSSEMRLIVGGTVVAQYAYSSDEVAVGKWTQYTATYNSTDDEYKIYLDGILKVTSTTAASDNSGIDTLRLGSDKGDANDYDGQMRDVLVYGTAFTQTQVELLYSGEYIGAPNLYWKMDEGTGATVYDSSNVFYHQGAAGAPQNGTITNASWVVPDYTFGERGGNYSSFIFSATSGTTWEQPKGNLNRCGRFGSVFGAGGMLPDGVVINHNSGTHVMIGNIADYQSAQAHRGGLPNPVWNLIFDQTSTGYGMDGCNNWIENKVSGSAAGYFSMYHQGDLILGNKDQACTIEGTAWWVRLNQLYSNKGVRGFSDLHPATFPSNIEWKMDYGSLPTNSEKVGYVANLNIEYDWALDNIGNNNAKITVGYNPESAASNAKVTGSMDSTSDAFGFTMSGGSMEFAALTIAASASAAETGTTFRVDPNMRAKFNGDLTNSGSLIASGAQLHFTPSSKPSLAYGDDIYLGNNDTQWWIQKADTHRFPTAKSLGTILANQTGNFYSDLTIGSNTNNHTNFLLGGTDACQFTNQHDHEFYNFKLGISSVYNAGSKITSVHGNMTNGGGMHGVFTASFNGTDDYLKVDDLNASYNGAGTSVPTGYLDAWIRTTDADGTIIHQRNAADSANAFKMRVVGGKAAAQWYTNGTMDEVTGTTDVDDGIWHHIAWRGDGTDADTSYRFQSLYVDGKLEAHDTTYSGWMTTQTQDIFYGANSPTEGGGFFDGDISRVCIIAGQQNASSANDKIRIPTEADMRRMAFMDYYTFSGTSDFEYSGNVAASPTVQWYQFDKGVGLTAYDYSGWAHVAATGTVSGSASAADFWYGDGLTNPNNFEKDTSTLDFPSTATSSCWGNGLYVNNLTCGTSATSVFNFCRFASEGPISYYGTFKGGLGSMTRTNGSRPGYEHVGNNSSPWTYMRDGSNFEVDASNDEFFGDVITYYYSSGTVGALPKMKLATLLATNASGGFIELAGDLVVGSINPDSHGSIRTNGYNIKATYFNPYNTAVSGLRMDAGSDLMFTNARSWNYTWPDDYDNTFKLDAQGIEGANFRGVTSKGIVMNAATDIGRDSVYKGSFTISLWVYLPADMQPTLDVANGGFFGGGGGGQPGGGVDLWSYSLSPSWYFDINGAAGDERSAQSASIVAGDLGKLHHIVCVLDRSGGVDTGDGIQKLYQSIAGEDATPQRIASGSVNVNFDGVSNTKLWTIGHGGLSYWTDGGGTSGPVIADFRIWQGGADGAVGALDDAQITTLYNGGDTTVNGTGVGYPDSTNSLNANTWYKLDRTAAGLTSLIDTVSGNNATYASAYTGQTGWCTMSGSGIVIGNQGVGRPPIPAGGATLQNFYSSGTVDYTLYSGTVGSTDMHNPLVTKGRVVFD